ncbi:putative cell division cycle protein 20-like [Apostichopus japonicus]|uniref:Cell division cycle protein 20 homolog n=1 Tax=Stichopus japonicus TaxID=307972 RepID=A0A2G8K7L9_STIJA|nr:putative cell division cycle protein 20-like [Apostichopus japonicus]
MSHLGEDINHLLCLDGSTGGPAMRWQRKTRELNSCNTSLNMSVNRSLNRSHNASTLGSPMRALNQSLGGSSKTPGKKTPGKKSKTPTRTPGGDRFIPNRNATDFEVGNYKLVSDVNHEDEQLMSPSKLEYRRVMNENLNGKAMDSKILRFKQAVPSAPEGFQNNLKVLYSQTKTPSSAHKTTRHIPQIPERILDAPEIMDDYYLNLIDWSCSNYLAVALANNVYLWNATSGDIQQLLQLENPDDYISCVSWIPEGNFLAVGTSSGTVQLWDVDQSKRLRTMTGHAARVGSLSWNSYILSSGSRTGNIHHHDVRAAEHHVATLSGHTQEVCGLRWSPDGKVLASGANDNLLNIWPAAIATSNSPQYSFTQHQAAVKALAWCPWQPSLLASGGGTADRHIRFWNVNNGTCINSVDTKSQVCSLLWSKEYKELVSGHGYAQNQIVIWKYPMMQRVTELLGHTARILHMCMSPDGSTIISAAADETLRLWKCFATDPHQKKKITKPKMGSLTRVQSIR